MPFIFDSTARHWGLLFIQMSHQSRYAYSLPVICQQGGLGSESYVRVVSDQPVQVNKMFVRLHASFFKVLG